MTFQFYSCLGSNNFLQAAYGTAVNSFMDNIKLSSVMQLYHLCFHSCFPSIVIFAPLFHFVVLSNYIPVLLSTFYIVHEKGHHPNTVGSN